MLWEKEGLTVPVVCFQASSVDTVWLGCIVDLFLFFFVPVPACAPLLGY